MAEAEWKEGAHSRAPKAVAWRWQLRPGGQWIYGEVAPSCRLVHYREPLYATPPPQSTACFECDGPLHGPYCPACRPAPQPIGSDYKEDIY